MKKVPSYYYAFFNSFLFDRLHSFRLLFLKLLWRTRNLFTFNFRKSFSFSFILQQNTTSSRVLQILLSLRKKLAIRLLFSTQNNSITFFVCVCGEKISFWQKDWFWGNFRRIMQVSVFFSWEIIQSVLKRKNLFVRKEKMFTNTEATLRLFCKFFPLKRKSCSNSFCFFNLSFLLFFNRIVN